MEATDRDTEQNRSIEADTHCQHLDWDSGFFGRRIARLTLSQVDQESIEHAMHWCHRHAIDCLYFLANADNAETVRLAEENKFRLVDIRVTLEKQLGNVQPIENRESQHMIRPHTLDDLPALRALAKVSHRDSRFYYDSNFSEPLCDALYETWIEKSCQGYAEVVFVANWQDQIAGYISCHRLDDVQGQIGLVGVAAPLQGKGLGKLLVNQVVNWFAEREIRRVTVVTQGRNVKAQRLYYRCGFMPYSVQLWYHRWFDH